MNERPRIPGLRRLLRPRAPDETIERDIDDEIRFHIESRTEELMSGGMDRDQARERAEREYGDRNESRRELAAVDQRYRTEERRANWWDALSLDLRYALRGIGRNPGFAAVVVLTLTLGIGANAIMFGVVDRLLLQPPPHVAEPDRIARLYFEERISWLPADAEPNLSPFTTYRTIDALRRSVPSISGAAAIGGWNLVLGRGVDAQEISAALVDVNFFSLLGTRPALGRFFAPDEGAIPTGAAVAVISHAFWRRHFGSADDVLQRELLLEGQPFTIIGVAPAGFTGIDLTPVDVWISISALAGRLISSDWHSTPNVVWLRPVVRLAPEAAHSQVEAEATLTYRNLIRSEENSTRDTLARVLTASIIAARGPGETPREARVSIWLLGVSAVVLLVACANIANLLIARALRRRREIAVRLALGVSRGRLLRQLLTETFLLALIAAAAALLLSHWGGGLVRTLLLGQVAWAGSPIDARTLMFTALAAFVTALLAGIAPGLQAMRTDVAGSLKSGARDGGGRRSTLRTGLLVFQTALSVVLLVGAGLFVRSLNNVRGLDTGLDLERVFLVRMNLSRAGFDTGQVRRIYQTAYERAAALPGVARVTMVAATVPMRSANAARLSQPHRDTMPPLPTGGPYYSAVDSDYFSTIGARIVQGRSITERDVAAGARVAVVNRYLASMYWPDENPIGQCLRMGSEQECTEIVGVVQDVLLFNMVDDERGQYYVPRTHPFAARQRPAALLVRTTGEVPGIAAMLQREIQAMEPGMPFVEARLFSELVAPQLSPWRLGATMFTLFGILALVIAAVGLYSVISYVTSQRTHEIGVRMALGADRRDVIRMVLFGGVKVVGAGLALGAVVALLAGRWVEPLLYQTSPRDPAIFVAVAVALAAAAVLASVLPAWRAARVDPAVALRTE